MKECLEMIAFVLPQLKIHDNLLDDPKYAYLFTVEKVNELVLEGVPFRDAYKQVGEMVEKNEFVPGIKFLMFMKVLSDNSVIRRFFRNGN